MPIQGAGWLIALLVFILAIVAMFTKEIALIDGGLIAALAFACLFSGWIGPNA